MLVPSIRQLIRLRPATSSKLFGDDLRDDKSLSLFQNRQKFDSIYQSEVTQFQIFEQEGKEIANHCLNGGNSTLLIYGDKLAGKKYTLFGQGGGSNRGLIELVIEYLINKNRSGRFQLCFYVIDQDQVKDLRTGGSSVTRTGIQIQSDAYEFIWSSLPNLKSNSTAVFCVSSLDSSIGTLTFVLVNQKLPCNDLDQFRLQLNALLNGREKQGSVLMDMLDYTFTPPSKITIMQLIDPNVTTNPQPLVQLDSTYQLKRPASARKINRIRQLEGNIQEMRSKMEQIQDQFNSKIQKFSELVGIDKNIKNILNANVGDQIHTKAKQHRESIETLQNIKKRNQAAEKKLDYDSQLLQNLSSIELENQQKQQSELKQLSDIIQQIKQEIQNQYATSDQQFQEQVLERAEELQKLLIHSHMLLEEKTSTLHNVSFQLNNRATDISNIIDHKEIGRNEIEHELQAQVRRKEQHFLEELEKMDQGYNDQILKMNEDVKNFYYDSKSYLRKQKEKQTRVKREALDLYGLIISQRKIIDCIAQGQLNSGIRPILIPTSDYPMLPNKYKFPNLFKATISINEIKDRYQIMQKARFSSVQRSRYSSQGIQTPKTTGSFTKMRPMSQQRSNSKARRWTQNTESRFKRNF